VGEAYELSKSIVIQYRAKLDEVAQRLLEVETITREEFEEIFPPPVTKNSGTAVPQSAVPQMA
jgi:cell division protease FtsH